MVTSIYLLSHNLYSFLTCWCIIPTFTGLLFESNRLLWFVYLYAFAGYIKLYSPKTNIKGITYILLSFALTVLTFLSAVAFDVLSTRIPLFENYSTFLYEMRSLPIVVISVLMLVGFLKLNIGYKRIINIISSVTFGVYLIHDNIYVRPFLWNTIFKNASYSDSRLLGPYSLFVIAIVFVLCTIIELARIYIFEKHYMGAVNAVANIADNFKEKIFSLSFWDKI